jgi:hypothetical protein
MPTLEVNEELIMALLAQLPPEQRERILSHVATARVQKSNQHKSHGRVTRKRDRFWERQKCRCVYGSGF